MTELARATNLPVSTTHRLVGELAARRILERTSTDEYRIGLPLRRIGAAGDQGFASLLDRARAPMRDLANTLRSPVRLGLLRLEAVAQAEFVPDAAPPTEFTPAARPAHTTALGRVLLAFAASDRILAVLTADGVPFELLRRNLSDTRVHRSAVVGDEVNRLSGAIAMPVFGPGGEIHAAVEVAVADLRTGLTCARAALTVATNSLARMLATAPATTPEIACGG